MAGRICLGLGSLGFEHAAIAIAAFETVSCTFMDSPWNRYLNGEKSAFTKQQKLGAILFSDVPMVQIAIRDLC